MKIFYIYEQNQTKNIGQLTRIDLKSSIYWALAPMGYNVSVFLTNTKPTTIKYVIW